MTSNDISQLPAELFRAGRIDGIWYFTLPNEEERRAIFDIHFKKTNKTIDDRLLDDCAKLTKNYTGSEIEQIVISAIRKTFVNNKRTGSTDQLSIHALNDAIAETVPLSKSHQHVIAHLESWAKEKARYASAPQPMKKVVNVKGII